MTDAAGCSGPGTLDPLPGHASSVATMRVPALADIPWVVAETSERRVTTG